jgi:hypothetical protein
MDIKEFNNIVNPTHPDFSEGGNVIDDNEILILNKRFFEVKAFVKSALGMSVPVKPGIAAKVTKYTIDPGTAPIMRTHRISRRKR